MAKVINCECGFVARGGTDDQVVEAIRAHMATDHTPTCSPRSSPVTSTAG